MASAGRGVDPGGKTALSPKLYDAALRESGAMPRHWVNYVQVQNCDEAAAKMTSLGGKVCMPPTDIPNTGRFAMLQDPQGAMISVIGLGGQAK
jgi:uncharacterized protein